VANGKIRRGDSSKHDSDDEDFTGGGLSASVRNFSVTQMALDTSDTTWMESKDIVVKGFSISTSSKVLMKNADLLINDGQKYGLLGPNGHGKTTLLKMMACGELKIPPGIDMLMVEQECAADDTKAIDAVLSADKQRTKLLKNEKRIIELLESGMWCSKLSLLQNNPMTLKQTLNKTHRYNRPRDPERTIRSTSGRTSRHDRDSERYGCCISRGTRSFHFVWSGFHIGDAGTCDKEFQWWMENENLTRKGVVHETHTVDA
jgi:hypothetical protein